MREAIESKTAPNLFVVHYDKAKWLVSNVILLPHFAFSLSIIEKRKPLSPSARRAGWVGCNILLGRIPADARVAVVTSGFAVEPTEVRKQFASMRRLEGFSIENRGWTLDVLNEVRRLGKAEFTLHEVYASETSLRRIHPRNYHIRDKIRQQLQVLRDMGLIEFLGYGQYRLVGAVRSVPLTAPKMLHTSS